MIAFLRRTLALCSALSVLAAAGAHAQLSQTMGFAVTSLKTAGIETPYLDECPEGVALGNDEIWWKSLSPRNRDTLTDSGRKEPSARRATATLRGPKGEDVCWNPSVVRDPPLRTVKGLTSRGFNLDGTETGESTARTCAHEKFTSADGTVRIDNQLRRLTGCIHGWRSNGYIEMTSDTERRNSSFGIILIQVSGITDTRNTPDVNVRIYRAADVMPKDAAGNILPFASYRIDGNPRYGVVLKGRITDGVLTTDPADVHLPFYGNRVETEFFIRDFRLELTMTDTGARGLIGGYHDLANWWDYVRKMGYLVETAQFSCPALYAAALELADGHPDQTGACTSLSAAYTVEAVRAFVNETPKPLALPPEITAAATSDALPPGVKVGALASSEVLTTASGHTLYVRTASAACDNACRARYAPLPAAWRAQRSGNWTIVEIDAQARQWTYNGNPVFVCSDDFDLGDINCASADHQPLMVKRPSAIPSAFKIIASEVGPVLADHDGRTLYRFIGSMPEFMHEICNAACVTQQWRIVSAGENSPAPQGPFSVGPAGDNSKAWLFRNGPVYTFAGDDGPGVVAGHRFGGASVSTKNWFSALTVADAIAVEASNPQKDEQR